MNIPAVVKQGLRSVPFYGALRRAFNSYLAHKRFRTEFFAFKRESNVDSRFKVDWLDRYPCLADNTGTTGFDRHYIYHPAWAARIPAQCKPALHIDISSTLHFSTIVSAFVPVHFYDFRPADLKLKNLESEAADLLALPFADDSVESLSCMHVAEHVGLGRYGDPLDPLGDLKAIDQLKRVLAVGGVLLFVVPVGKPKVSFNAHRIYSYEQIIGAFEGLHLVEWALIPEDGRDGGLEVNADPAAVQTQDYGCGCFWFTKKESI